MTRTFYSYAIFFAGLYIVTAILESIILFVLGPRMYDLGSLPNWLFFAYGISLVWSLLLLKYFHYRRYMFPLWTLITSTAVSFFHFVIFMHVLQTREMTSYYIAAVLLAPATAAVYGITLIFSNAGRNPWLKAGGIFIFFIGLGTFSTTLWALDSPGVMLNGTLEKAEQWITLFAAFVPLLFLMNFIRERASSKEVDNSRANAHDHFSGEVGVGGMKVYCLDDSTVRLEVNKSRGISVLVTGCLSFLFHVTSRMK